MSPCPCYPSSYGSVMQWTRLYPCVVPGRRLPRRTREIRPGLPADAPVTLAGLDTVESMDVVYDGPVVSVAS